LVVDLGFTDEHRMIFEDEIGHGFREEFCGLI